MMSVELKHHSEEWFFLHNFDIDKVFSTRTVRFIWLTLLPLWA